MNYVDNQITELNNKYFALKSELIDLKYDLSNQISDEKYERKSEDSHLTRKINSIDNGDTKLIQKQMQSILNYLGAHFVVDKDKHLWVEENKKKCSFCGKSQDEVDKIIAGNGLIFAMNV